MALVLCCGYCLLQRLNAMDEVWVPTDYSRAVFAAGGVDPSKLVVVPEAVDADFFDPKSMQVGAGARSALKARA